MITVKAVKYKESTGDVSIDYLEYNDTSKGWDEKSIRSQERPEDEFIDSLKGLAAAHIVLAELPAAWEKDITVTGFSITTKDERRTLSLKSYRSLKSGRPLNVNGPAVDLDSESDAGNEKVAAVITALERAVNAAEAYIAGHRAQIPLLDDDGNPSNPYGERTAKGQGWAAAFQGESERQNPYDVTEDSDAYHSWEDGWCEAKKLKNAANGIGEIKPPEDPNVPTDDNGLDADGNDPSVEAGSKKKGRKA